MSKNDAGATPCLFPSPAARQALSLDGMKVLVTGAAGFIASQSRDDEGEVKE